MGKSDVLFSHCAQYAGSSLITLHTTKLIITLYNSNYVLQINPHSTMFRGESGLPVAHAPFKVFMPNHSKMNNELIGKGHIYALERNQITLYTDIITIVQYSLYLQNVLFCCMDGNNVTVGMNSTYSHNVYQH